MHYTERERVRLIYQDMSQEELSRINPEDLTDLGRQIYEEECRRRQSPSWIEVETQRQAADDAEQESWLQWRRSPRPLGIGIISGLLFLGGGITTIAFFAAIMDQYDTGNFTPTAVALPAIFQIGIGIGLLRRSSLSRLAYIVLAPFMIALGMMINITNIWTVFVYCAVVVYLIGRRSQSYFSYRHWQELSLNSRGDRQPGA